MLQCGTHCYALVTFEVATCPSRNMDEGVEAVRCHTDDAVTGIEGLYYGADVSDDTAEVG
jgi:hypothetical protein